MTNEKIFCGVDVGASATKVVILNGSGELLGYKVERTGAQGPKIARECLDAILQELALEADAVAVTVSTGYARDDIPFADERRTEITCHSKGCLQAITGPITVVDIGGQDNKIIHLDENGKRIGFKFNRKCAAGTGAFLEEIALLLNVPIEEINGLAEKSETPVKLGSFCTVFAKTEILTNFRRGDRIADILAGAFESVARRIVEMDPLDGNIVLTGGVVAHNPYMIRIFESMLEKEVHTPPKPQFTGAIGAALIGIDIGKQE